MSRRRLAAAAALLFAAAALVTGCVLAVSQFPRGLVAPAGVALALAVGWFGALHRGAIRAFGLGVAVLATAAILLVVLTEDPVAVALMVAGAWASLACARIAFRIHVALPPARPPAHPVLFYNPRSGGGKAERFHLVDEARARGIEPVELAPGTDLVDLVRAAIAHGSDGLAMAGGDGSQAIVAALAAEAGLPYACIPAGTRNHFALDLGVDRDDVVGALDAFVDGGERVVDLADVNGRVFVNNVSLGLYATAVQRNEYRDAKLRTLLDTVPELAEEPATNGVGMRWNDPDGPQEGVRPAILISNNRYRLGQALGSGTRPRMDEGVLGVAVIGVGRMRDMWRQWTAPAFDVEATGPVPAGIDGEAVLLEPPLRFRMHPHTLHVRIARAHPGASPSAIEPDGTWRGLVALGAIVTGREDDDAPVRTA